MILGWCWGLFLGTLVHFGDTSVICMLWSIIALLWYKLHLTFCALCLTHLSFPYVWRTHLYQRLMGSLSTCTLAWCDGCNVYWAEKNWSAHSFPHAGHVVILVSYHYINPSDCLPPSAPSPSPLVIRQSPRFCTHPPACCLLLPKCWCSPSRNQK